jgi:predicted ATP-dependent serine protease
MEPSQRVCTNQSISSNYLLQVTAILTTLRLQSYLHSKMVPLPKILASNSRIPSIFPDGFVAVFVGGTSGVGEYTLLKLAKYILKLRVFLVGRSQESADRIIKEAQQLSPDSKFEFIKSDVSLIVNVDEVCRKIKSKETDINLLFETQGTMSFKTSMYTWLSHIALQHHCLHLVRK